MIPEIQLHVFSDASEVAYGAVAYLHFKYKNGSVHCCVVMSKAHLAPIKSITLPRLELNAAVVGIRLYRILIQDIDVPVQSSHFRTDSLLTLQYMKAESQRFKVFVANRVREIREASSPDQWNHIPGDKNPADVCSRGTINILELNKNDVS